MKRARYFCIGLFALGLGLAACRPGPADSAATAPAATAPATAALPTPRPEPTLAASSPAIGPREDATAARLLADLLSDQAATVEGAIEAAVTAGDQRFVPVFIELLRAREVGLVLSDTERLLQGLESLSGQRPGRSWVFWFEWYGTTNLGPPPGFTAWKGQLLARIDPGFARFLHAGARTTIRVEEIVWGGVAVDGIPALDNPPLLAAPASQLNPDEPVLGLLVNGEARAYPLRLLEAHEMANDILGGVPISLAYCTLCGAAIAYDGRGPDDQVFTFGTSGLLYRSNKLMYDRLTATLWNQLTGEPVLGALAGSGLRLGLWPVVLTSWSAWLSDHPDSGVLDLNTGLAPAEYYQPGGQYSDYFASGSPLFPVWERSERLPDKTQIYALRLDNSPKAYPVAELVAQGVVNDRVGQTNVVLIAPDAPLVVQGASEATGRTAYEAGAAIRAYARGDHHFVAGPDTRTLNDESGRRWQISEEALLGPGGARLDRLPGHLAYWFGWFAFFPQTAIYGD